MQAITRIGVILSGACVRCREKIETVEGSRLEGQGKGMDLFKLDDGYGCDIFESRCMLRLSLAMIPQLDTRKLLIFFRTKTNNFVDNVTHPIATRHNTSLELIRTISEL